MNEKDIPEQFTLKLEPVVRAVRLVPEAILPTRAHPGDAGLDLIGIETTVLGPHEGKRIRTGIALELPTHTVGMIADRSSLAKKGIKTTGGIIDSGYRGEVQVILWNLSTTPVEIKAGDRVAQLLMIPIALPDVEEAKTLTESDRGEKGFGSTGR